jgi:membrane protease YdiL (CAAX protease family)
MMERIRILLVATPTAPVRGLAARLRDPDIDVMTAESSREALERVAAGMPDIVIIDGGLPGREVFRLYGRLRSTAAGAAVPIIFSSHERSDADAAPTTSPDYYLPPDAPLDEVEQLVYSFLPEAFVEEGPPPVTDAGAAPDLADDDLAYADRTSAAPPKVPFSVAIMERLRSGQALVALAYLGIYVIAELLASVIDTRLGVVVHAGLLLAIFFHGANVPSGPQRTFFWTLWLAPLTRIYGLAQPYAGAPPLTWWALTAIPMAVAGVVAMRLAGQTARESGLIPRPREVPIAVFMVPVGLALGVLVYLLLEPRALGRELAFGGLGLVALIVILNPGIVDELVFRGVLQRAATTLFGSTFAIIYNGLLYAPVLPAGLVAGGGLLGVAITFGIGLLLAFITARTGSILSAAVAHASLALGLFVIAPYLVPGGLAGAAPPPVPATPGADVRTPTAVPPLLLTATVLATRIPPPQPAAGQPSPVSEPAPGPAPKPTAPAPQPQATPQAAVPGQPTVPSSTPVSLATPVQAPPAVPPGVPPPEPPGSAPPGQIVVVRGTGGAGARLRAQPGNTGPILTVVAEYTPLVIIGPDRIVDGVAWRNVRAAPGGDGWIAASFVTTGGAP